VLRKSIHSPRQRELLALLRSTRDEAGLSQSELARRLAKPQSFVSKYEAGERRIDIVELEQICKALGVPLSEFVRRFENGR